MDRRTMIYRLARGGLLASLALVAGILISRKQVSLGRECGLAGPCRDCSKLKRCQLPGAVIERGNEKG